MANRSCAPAQSHAHSGTPPLSASLASSQMSASMPAELRDQCERAVSALRPVRELLTLLTDCAMANGDSAAEMRAESLAVMLSDMAEQLTAAEPEIDTLASLGRDHAPDSELSGEIESQGFIVHAVRHTLCVLYDVIGHGCRSFQSVTVDAFTGTTQRLAERLSGVEERLAALAFPHAHSVPSQAALSLPASMPAPPPKKPTAVRMPAPPKATQPRAARAAKLPRPSRLPARAPSLARSSRPARSSGSNGSEAACA